jgi:hypothetical protein
LVSSGDPHTYAQIESGSLSKGPLFLHRILTLIGKIGFLIRFSIEVEVKSISNDMSSIVDSEKELISVTSTLNGSQNTHLDTPSLGSFCCLSPMVKKLILLDSSSIHCKGDFTTHYINSAYRLNWKNLSQANLILDDDFRDTPSLLDGVLEKNWFIASLNIQKMSLEVERVMVNTTAIELSKIYPRAFSMDFGGVCMTFFAFFPLNLDSNLFLLLFHRVFFVYMLSI